MDGSHLYEGDRGRSYYEQRAAARSKEVQRRRSLIFRDIADPNAVILDFGCGNGGVLAALSASKRIGVEISPYAVAEANTVLDMVIPSLKEIDTGSVDAVISFHALEHTADPFQQLRDISRVLKSSGKFSLIVPYEYSSFQRAVGKWKEGDNDMHLYGWTPLTFGNLCTLAGLKVLSSTLLPISTSERFGPWLGGKISWLKALTSGRLQVCARGVASPRK